MKTSTNRSPTIPPFTEFNITLTRDEAIRLAALCGSIGCDGVIRDVINPIYYAVVSELKLEGLSLSEQPLAKQTKKEIAGLTINPINY